MANSRTWVPLCRSVSHHWSCAWTPESIVTWEASIIGTVMLAAILLGIWGFVQAYSGRWPRIRAILRTPEGFTSIVVQALWIILAFLYAWGNFLWPIGWILWWRFRPLPSPPQAKRFPPDSP